MRLLHAGVDVTTIALWLGHESAETTQIYLHADLSMKEAAINRTRPMHTNRPLHAARPTPRLPRKPLIMPMLAATPAGAVIPGRRLPRGVGASKLARVRACERCVGDLLYCDKYDADFCPSCDRWTGDPCGDPTCGYCRARPDAPSRCDHPDRHYSTE